MNEGCVPCPQMFWLADPPPSCQLDFSGSTLSVLYLEERPFHSHMSGLRVEAAGFFLEHRDAE